MILDEATANIDTETELLIQDSMEKDEEHRNDADHTHRLSTISMRMRLSYCPTEKSWSMERIRSF